MTTARLSATEAYITQLRALSDEELAEEAAYLAAATDQPPERVAGLSVERRMFLAHGEQTRRTCDLDRAAVGPDEWTVPAA